MYIYILYIIRESLEKYMAHHILANVNSSHVLLLQFLTYCYN